jgi:hypothetical protein
LLDGANGCSLSFAWLLYGILQILVWFFCKILILWVHVFDGLGSEISMFAAEQVNSLARVVSSNPYSTLYIRSEKELTVYKTLVTSICTVTITQKLHKARSY